MDTEMTTEEIKAHLTSEDANVAAAAVIYCAKEREELLEKNKELSDEIAKRDKASQDAFIEDLKCSGKLAPKDEAEEATWRGMFANDPEGARLLASKVPGANDGENIAGGKTGSGEDNRSAADIFQDDCPFGK